MVFLSGSTFVHSSFSASPILAPVSFNSCRSVAVLGVPACMRVSNSCSVGMNGSVSSMVYCGCVHVLPVCFRNPV